jgi:uncharacterized Fe-S cluster protein YjdI
MRKVYAGKHVDVSFDPEVCTHAAKCVHGLPAVFDAERRPWIEPDAASADDVMEQVRRCPSGALQAKRHERPGPVRDGPETGDTC